MRVLMYLLAAAVLLLAFLNYTRREKGGPFVVLQPPASERQQSGKRDGGLREYWAIPQFRLTERTGAQVTLDDLLGKVWLADFFYTTCPGPCPMLTSRLSAVAQQVGNEADVRLVSISTDPAKDTPEVLQAYAQKFGANERWLFLTGEKSDIFTLANHGFKLSVTDDPTGAEPVTHTTKLALIDRRGVVRGFYEGLSEDSTAKIVEDIRRLLAEKP